MIALVDYGLGNIKAFENIYRRLGLDVWAARTPADLARADRLILPGVGAFDWAMTRLNGSGLRDALDHEVLANKKPVLGVCIGMQMMANRSDEGRMAGLGWIEADVRKFDTPLLNTHTHLPHMGWNDVVPIKADTLFKGLEASRFYFLHSYYVVPHDEANTLAFSDYGIPFAASIARGNIFGTQFHPEKSHQWGVAILGNFAAL